MAVARQMAPPARMRRSGFLTDRATGVTVCLFKETLLGVLTPRSQMPQFNFAFRNREFRKIDDLPGEDRDPVARAAECAPSDNEFLNRNNSRMPNFVNLRQKSSMAGMGPSGALLGILPTFVIFYLLLVLPFLPNDGHERQGNIVFWPLLAGITLTLVFLNWARIEFRFFRSPPIMSLVGYLLFAAASVTWAFSPDLAFSRMLLQVLAFIVVVVPYALPVSRKYTIQALYLCYAAALVLSAVFVLTTPSTPIGHPGYFTHKQDLGLLAGTGIILSSHELLHRGWRRIVGFIAIGLAFWLIVESESKSTLALSLVAIPSSWLMLVLCKKTRLTPAYFVAAVVLASMLVTSPIEKIGSRLYGDATLTGRTGIWGFANYQISHRPWLGWGFHSYYFVPNSPQNEAPGYIREMPSSHSGYLDLRLETGRIGYWIFLVFIYSSLHLMERVRRKDPARAWLLLSIQLFALMINLLDTNWIVLTHFWLLYLIAVAESVRCASQGSAPSPARSSVVRAVTPMRTLYRQI
jgi:exopolysaccharide production protein ExoQ